jgi:hypothetical protein
MSAASFGSPFLTETIAFNIASLIFSILKGILV